VETIEATWKEASEVAKKAVKEERQKKDEEERNDDATPMDIDIPNISTTCSSGHS